jgi:hypothetical protein
LKQNGIQISFACNVAADPTPTPGRVVARVRTGPSCAALTWNETVRLSKTIFYIFLFMILVFQGQVLPNVCIPMAAVGGILPPTSRDSIMRLVGREAIPVAVMVFWYTNFTFCLVFDF